MKKMNKFDKTVAALSSVGFSVWLGGSVIRLITAFDLFEPNTQMVLKNSYSPELKTHIVKMFAGAVPYTDISFIVLLLGSIYSLVKFNKELKNIGWLIMSIILVLLVAIPSLYLAYLDYNLAINMFWNGATFDSQAVKDFFMLRFTKLNVLDPLILLSGITIAALCACRPLHKKADEASQD
jgi:hypothetical protein